ncbi:hypothetical protein HDU86_006716 [Geranomyces michiganensis]|nr:hypothetical protein HDU86_006716 [Geranomyces michiganensis]
MNQQPHHSPADAPPPPRPSAYGCTACLALLRARRRPTRRRVDPQHLSDPPLASEPPASPRLKKRSTKQLNSDSPHPPPQITVTAELSGPVESLPPPPTVIPQPARAPLPASWTTAQEQQHPSSPPISGRPPSGEKRKFDVATSVPKPPRPRPTPLPPITRVASTPALAPLLQAETLQPSASSMRGSHSLRGSLSALFRIGKSSPHLSTSPPPPPPPPIPVPLTVYATTWNLNARTPTCNHLFTPSLPPAGSAHSPHLIAVGTQECESSLEKAVLAQPSNKPRWTAQLCEMLCRRPPPPPPPDGTHHDDDPQAAESSQSPPQPASYELIATRTLVGLHLALFARTDMARAVRGVEGAEAAVYMNGAKGAVALACTVMGFSFCFVNAHLRAHEGAVATRNADWNRINDTLPLYGYSDADRACRAGGLVERYDHVFWLGDLNYRTNLGGPQKVEWARSLLERDDPDIGVFIINDELRRAYHARQVFTNFSEARITFPPTFKLIPSGCPPTASPVQSTTTPTTSTTAAAAPSPSSSLSTQSQPTPQPVVPAPHPALYDRSPKRRTPSYTDRILYRSRIHPTNQRHRNNSNSGTSDQHQEQQPTPGLGPGLNTSIVPIKYDAVQMCSASDHKAVWGLYMCTGVDVGPIVGGAGDQKKSRVGGEQDEEDEGEEEDYNADGEDHGRASGCSWWRWSQKRRRRRWRARLGKGSEAKGSGGGRKKKKGLKAGRVQPLEEGED